MFSWRGNSFATLRKIKECVATYPELSNYVSYLDLLERGLRKEALKHLEDLLSILGSLPVEKKRSFASLLCRETNVESSHRLIPEPLHRRFISPVIHEWKRAEPQNPEPFRWTSDLSDLVHALELDTSCDQTRRRLILRILGYVGVSIHELPSGYLGVVEDDYDLLRIAKREAELLKDVVLRTAYLKMIEE
ncbi:MAG: hypothetical protein K0R17_3064, partial [Rariglobus sp.]|nr:hypothetical protein [Rariglobus sp.]